MTFDEAEFYYNNYYNKGIGTSKLASMFGHGHHYYLDAFKKYGFKIRSNKVNSRKYSANFDYFESIDSHEKAYWLGFIYADGYISNNKNGKKIGIAISSKDEEHLYKFNRCLSSTYPVKRYIQKQGYKQGTIYCRVLISNDKMFEDLKSHGVFENKTDILTRPQIQPDFYNSFILGYFDGDGSIFLNNGRSPFYSINIVGTDDILSFIHEQLTTNGITNKLLNLEKRKNNQNVSYIRYGGNNVVSKVHDYLYKDIDNTLPLRRKQELFIKCVNREFQ